MEWESWQCALLVAQLGTIAAAAGRLSVDPTTVSRRVKRLEQRLGVRILERQGHRLEPTAAFREALANVEAAESALHSAEMALSQTPARPLIRSLRITAVPYLVDYLLVPGLPTLLSRMRLRVELVADNRNLSLSRREADLAVRFASGPPGAGSDRDPPRGRKLGALAYAVYGSVASDDPGRLPWATFDDVYAHLPEARWTLRALGAARPQFKVSRTESLRELVANGLAKALLPEIMGERDPRLVRLSPKPVLKRDVCLISLSSGTNGSYLDAVGAWLDGLFERHQELMGRDLPAA